MKTTTDNIEEVQRSLSIPYRMFIAGLIVFATIVAFISPTRDFYLNFKQTFTLVALVMTIIMVPLGHFIFQKRIAQAREADDMPSKLALYRRGFITRCSTLEGVALLSIICTFLTHNFAYYIFLAITLVVFATVNPTLIRMKQQLEITD